jgi:excinuclease ABC subunit B
LERVEIMQDLRRGLFDVLIGVNLLREGLDLPEVSLVAIIDADKEGFLRSARSLTQTVGRAARHLNGKAIMYADTITKSMQKTMDETNYRREKQLAFNKKHGISPTPLNKSVDQVFGYETEKAEDIQYAAEPDMEYLTADQVQKLIRETRKAMETAAKELDFVEAARLRDRMKSYQDHLKNKNRSV